MARLLLFAAAREAAGVRTADVDAHTVGAALDEAVRRFGPQFARVLACCTILHGDRTVARDAAATTAVAPDDEIAVLPPVSGGADFRMIDVGDKDETQREATAACRLIAAPQTRANIMSGTVKKGDAVSQAKVAGTLAAKRVPELIPMCHPVRMTFIQIDIAAVDDEEAAIDIRATVRGRDRTGFEMEALTACAVAALTLYDMAKSEDPTMRVTDMRLVAKSGGKSGDVTFE